MTVVCPRGRHAAAFSPAFFAFEARVRRRRTRGRVADVLGHGHVDVRRRPRRDPTRSPPAAEQGLPASESESSLECVTSCGSKLTRAVNSPLTGCADA